MNEDKYQDIINLGHWDPVNHSRMDIENRAAQFAPFAALSGHDQAIQNSVHDNADEVFPVVDERGQVIGKATRGECHGGSRLLHPVVHLHVFNREGDLYLQRRPMWKDIQPGRWDTAVGGHVDYGEEVLGALRREAREELGLVDFEAQRLVSYVFESDRERELVNVFKTVCDEADVHPSDELDGGRFWSLDEIQSSLGQGIFTPNFEQEIRRLALLD